MAKITLFSQVIGKLPKEIIRKIIRTAGTDKHCKGYDTWSQLVSMVFCQFSQCDSVRDISNGLRSATGNLNHLGIRRAPSKSTVAYQNAHRDSGVFRDGSPDKRWGQIVVESRKMPIFAAWKRKYMNN